MRITVTDLVSGATSVLEIADEITIETLRGLIASELHIPINRQKLFFKNQTIETSSYDQTVQNLGIKDDDVLGVLDVPVPGHQSTIMNNNDLTQFLQQIDFSGIHLPSRSGTDYLQSEAEREATSLLHRVEEDPNLIDFIALTFPSLAKALKEGDRPNLVNALKETHRKQRDEANQKRQKWLQIMANPQHPSSQQALMEEIHQRQIEEAYERAREFLPESFELNHVPIQAFVDSGAQSTLMSRKCAERCDLMRLVDTRFEGIAKGVGISKVVGRIHLVQIKMGNRYFAASITVLEGNDLDFLLGLDLLRRHQCSIDLHANVLRIGDETLPFLAESDIKKDNDDMMVGTKGGSLSSVTTAANINRQVNTTLEEKIKKLLQLGFDVKAARSALESTNENVDMAATLLFQEKDNIFGS